MQTHVWFWTMEKQNAGATMELVNLEMVQLRVETHRLLHRVLELEELQLQSLLEEPIPALFLMMEL